MFLPSFFDIYFSFVFHRAFSFERPWCVFKIEPLCDLVIERFSNRIISRSLNHPSTSIPIERAVPRMLLIAVSMEAAFRSGIFCLAMSSTCFAVTLPTLSLFGVPDPLAMPAARFNRTEAGGVLVMKEKDRSLYTETTTGMINPSISFWLVLALNCLQNSMMLICAWPSAGPTGGAGVALPAAICSFT